MAKTSDLTPKQARFCRELASGKSQAEAYRIAYDVGPEMARDNVRARVDALVAARERGMQQKALSQRDLVMERLREAVDDDDFGPNRLKAIQILAQVSGLMRNDIHLTQEDNRSADAIRDDLENKLLALGVQLEIAPEGDTETLEEDLSDPAANNSTEGIKSTNSDQAINSWNSHDFPLWP